jgi:exodeoxyribonuclease III
MKISTWNVNGVRAREGQVFDWLRLEQPDVLCLQEIKASPHQVPVSLTALEGYWAVWHGNKGYSGVALHVSKARSPVPPRFFHPPFDHENRIVAVELADLIVASIYVPNGGKDFPAKMKFLEAMEQFVAQAHRDGKKLILCGDLNVARTVRDVHPDLVQPEQIGQTPAERALLEKMLGHGLVDLGRFFAPDDDRLFTWWAPWRNCRERNIGWRLDYVLATDSLAKQARKCTAYREFGTSDHGPVTAVFEGSLFDQTAVKASAQAVIVTGEDPPPTAPQLDLFGAPVAVEDKPPAAPQLDLFGAPRREP